MKSDEYYDYDSYKLGFERSVDEVFGIDLSWLLKWARGGGDGWLIVGSQQPAWFDGVPWKEKGQKQLLMNIFRGRLLLA
jgi:hypothetical protein